MGKSDQQVRADDQQRVGVAGGDVESRVATIPRAPALGTGEVERASRRSLYRDLDGRRRIVGAGQVIPTGWEAIDEDASTSGRGDRTTTAHPTEALGRDAGRAEDRAKRGPRDGSSKPTKDQLLERAAELDVEGRSSMSKAQLERAIKKAEDEAAKGGNDGDGGGSSE